ncbi:MAG: ISAzo13 family transposase [Actinomycetia bacterium]|nr:ISAzo13 family transposase [Actinomycetes bacterium]MCP4959586.1 ISAzo13 family transposase [Actinomycetes bacterium]
MDASGEELGRLFGSVLPHLNEVQRRVVAGAVARELGRGGKTAVAEASGLSRNTVAKGVGEVEAGIEPSERLRAPGGGDKAAIDKQPGLLLALDELVDPDTRGNPMSPLRWTLKSTYELARTLTTQGFDVSAELTRRLLHQLGYSLQAPFKTKEGATHPDRDAQFGYINDLATDFLDDSQPVISVDTKKKELIGNYANGGTEWQHAGEPNKVNGHDFPNPELGEHAKATPYGIYDVGNNEGWVSVGDSADTAEFAVETIRRLWNQMGKQRFPEATRLLVTADAGGSNGYRVRAWRKHLADFAAETGLHITVVHYPPGTSKWNKIEHRMFSFISINWRGRPLTDMRTIVELIGSTTTRTGLTIQAAYDPNIYLTGTKVSNTEFNALPVKGHDWHPEWNYTLNPAA